MFYACLLYAKLIALHGVVAGLVLDVLGLVVGGVSTCFVHDVDDAVLDVGGLAKKAKEAELELFVRLIAAQDKTKRNKTTQQWRESE